MPRREVPRHRVRHARLRPRRRLRPRAERPRVRLAVPLAVRHVLELQLERPHTERPHGVQLAVQGPDVVVRRHAHRLPGRHGPAQRHVVGARPLGKRPEVRALGGRIRLAPPRLPVQVVARRVQIAVLLGAPHEFQLVEALFTGPRGPVEPLRHAAHGRTRPVAHDDPGDLVPAHQLPERLHGVEQAVVADAFHGDGVPAVRPPDGEPVPAGRQVLAGRRPESAERRLKTLSPARARVGRSPAVTGRGPGGHGADPHHERGSRGQGALVVGLGDVPGSRPAQHGAQRLHRVPVGAPAGDEDDLVGHGHGLRAGGGTQRLRPGPHRGRPCLAVPVTRGERVTGRGRHRSGGSPERTGDDGDSDRSRPLPVAPELHGSLLVGLGSVMGPVIGVPGWQPSPPLTGSECQREWPLCRNCPAGSGERG